MIDLRYRVTDPETAAPLLNRGIKRYVIVERSGAVLRIPETEKLGALRSTVSVPEMVKRDRVYGALSPIPDGTLSRAIESQLFSETSEPRTSP